MASLAIVSAISLISPRRWAKRILVVGLPLVGAVGVVLVYAWWHYPSDVIAGWCLALAWVTALWLAIRPRPERFGEERASRVRSARSGSNTAGTWLRLVSRRDSGGPRRFRVADPALASVLADRRRSRGKSV
jgi:membrane-associated phospholipid phosphatase